MHGQLPIIWNKAIDYNVYDINGNKWIDFTSTIFVTNVGHSNLRVNRAIKETLDNSLYSSYAYLNLKRNEYLKKLINFVGPPFEKAFLLSAGTEATEACLKLMRMHGQKIKKKKLGIVCFEGNWHGRTLGAQMMSSNEAQKKWIEDLDPEIHFLKFPYPWDLKGQSSESFLNSEILSLEKKGIDIKNDLCGFMLETFQGWGAVFYPVNFVKEIRRICDENNILLAFDEMQAGFGRTGKKFGFMHYDISPDLIACGKGMGGGTPLSGVIGKKHVLDLPETGNMSSTHSANPLVCAAGLAVIEELEEKKLIFQASSKGQIFFSALKNLQKKFPDLISYVEGKGMIWALIFNKSNKQYDVSVLCSKIAEICMQKGLLVVHTGRESIKLGPPLTIPEDALIEGVNIIEESIHKVLNQNAKL